MSSLQQGKRISYHTETPEQPQVAQSSLSVAPQKEHEIQQPSAPCFHGELVVNEMSNLLATKQRQKEAEKTITQPTRQTCVPTIEMKEVKATKMRQLMAQITHYLYILETNREWNVKVKEALDVDAIFAIVHHDGDTNTVVEKMIPLVVACISVKRRHRKKGSTVFLMPPPPQDEILSKITTTLDKFESSFLWGGQVSAYLSIEDIIDDIKLEHSVKTRTDRLIPLAHASIHGTKISRYEETQPPNLKVSHAIQAGGSVEKMPIDPSREKSKLTSKVVSQGMRSMLSANENIKHVRCMALVYG
ncbi:hypothetical protein Ae201684P_001200 [Aphanomyces euteiches]|nr:hypothetical protein Ae201684P_001200 [Aphanomyces euteiches]